MQIVMTHDYSTFKRLKGNRDIKLSHARKIQEAYAKNPEIPKYSPILVNENHEVIDGGHRLEALKNLGLPVHYIEEAGIGLNEVHALNSNTRPWTPVDFAKSYAESFGNKNYQTYLDFKKTYRLGHNTLISVLSLGTLMRGESVSSENVQLFRQGKFIVPDESASRELAENILGISNYYSGWKRKGFALAFIKFCRETEDYSQAKMEKHMKNRGHIIGNRNTIKDYYDTISDVYND